MAFAEPPVFLCRGRRSGKRFSTLGRRHLDPIAGRFLEPDSAEWLEPTKFAGINPYTYCLNDPIDYADPSGHSILLAALEGLVLGFFLASGIELGQQLANNNFNWERLDWRAIGRQAIIGATLGFAGGAGGAAFGGFLGATTTAVSGTKALAWFGISLVVSFSGGVGAYALETFGHDSEWDWGEAIGSGFMGMAAGTFAYGAGGIAKLVLGPNKFVTKYVLQFGVKTIFSWPLQFVESQLINYLS